MIYVFQTVFRSNTKRTSDHKSRLCTRHSPGILRRRARPLSKLQRPDLLLENARPFAADGAVCAHDPLR